MIKISAFGDSVLRGVVIDRETSDDSRIKYTFLQNNCTNICADRLGMEILNYGKFGSTVDTGEKMLSRHIASVRNSDCTLLEFGGNDCDYNWSAIADSPDSKHCPNNDPNTFSSKYRKLIASVRALGSKPVLLSLPPLDSDRFFLHVTRGMDPKRKNAVLRWLGGSVGTISTWHELYNLQLFKLGNVLDIPVIDITSAFLSRLNYRDYLCEDGIHPNEAGHSLIADAICSCIQVQPSFSLCL